MGQSESTQLDDDNCFRACLRDKKNNSLKTPATPIPTPQYSTNNSHPDPYSHDHNQMPPPSPLEDPSPLKDGQTSLEQRLQGWSKGGGECITKASVRARGVGNENQSVGGGQEEGGILGLQSKFSASHKGSVTVAGKMLRRGSTTVSGGTRCVSQKEVCTSQQTSSKSQQTISSARSRNVLLNKIQEIKQKYYERELEIQIYQDQHQYQQHLDKINSIVKQYNQDHSCLPLASVREISSIKQNIIDKLNKRKVLRAVQKNKQKKIRKTETDSGTEIAQDLELYSREEVPGLQESVRSEERNKKGEELNKSSRSLSVKAAEISFDDRVEFSEYSQQDTLHEIRQCDEQQEDYKSKMSSKMKMSHVLKMPSKKQTSQASIALPNIKEGKPNNIQGEQSNLTRSARGDESRAQASRCKEAGQRSVGSQRGRGQPGAGGNKLLLF